MMQHRVALVFTAALAMSPCIAPDAQAQVGTLKARIGDEGVQEKAFYCTDAPTFQCEPILRVSIAAERKNLRARITLLYEDKRPVETRPKTPYAGGYHWETTITGLTKSLPLKWNDAAPRSLRDGTYILLVEAESAAPAVTNPFRIASKKQRFR